MYRHRSTFQESRTRTIQDGDVSWLKQKGFLQTETPIRLILGFAIPHIRVGNKIYCPVWVEALYREHAQDLDKLAQELLSTSMNIEEQIVVAGEMLLGKEWDFARKVITAFLDCARATDSA